MSTNRSDVMPALRNELESLLVAASTETAGTACLLRVEVPAAGILERFAVGGLWREGEAATQATPFRIASITKTFSAVVVVQLAAEGRLGLDDLVVGHLPDDLFPLVKRLHVCDGASFGEQLTIRQLLNHSSGLFDYASCDQFFGEIAADPSRRWDPRDLLEGAASWGEPYFAPGEGYGYAYSDTGYVLLGLLIEHLDQRPLHEAYRARILDPLEMSATYLEGYESHRGPAMAHTFMGSIDTSPIHGSADWSGGGLVSDLDDLARFAQGLFSGALVSPDDLTMMLEYRFRTLDPERHTPGYVGYGLGIDARESGGLVWRGHRGHWGALLHVEPTSGVVVSGSVNDAELRPDTLFHGVVAALGNHGLLPATTDSVASDNAGPEALKR